MPTTRSSTFGGRDEVSDEHEPSGQIPRGIAPGTAVHRTLEFVFAQLSAWRDMPDRPNAQAEEELTSQICKSPNAANSSVTWA